MFSVLWKLGWFFKASWRRYTIAIVLLIIVNVFEMFPPKLLGNAIDDMQAGTFSKAGMLGYIALFLALGAVVLYLVLLLDVSAVWGSEPGRKNSQIQADGPFAENDPVILREKPHRGFDGEGDK